MRIIDRLYQYINFKSLSDYRFEHTCAISNGYLKKQLRGKGSIGSDIVEKIHVKYPDLSLIWLFTGKGEMLIPPGEGQELLQEEAATLLTPKDEMIQLFRNQIALFEAALADKQKIIMLLESQIKGKRPKGRKVKTGGHKAEGRKV